jgi:hypothetical protein
VRLVEKILPIPRRRFSVLVDRHDKSLDVLITPPFAGRLSAHIIKGTAIDLARPKNIGAPDLSPVPPTERLTFHRSTLLFSVTVTLPTEVIYLRQHLSKQKLSRCRVNPSPLE